MSIRDRLHDALTNQRVLDSLGLQRKMSAQDVVLPVLGIFGAGLAAGAALGLLFAPKAGTEIRGDIRKGVGNLRNRGSHDEGHDDDAQPTSYPKEDNPYV
jgi:hypothetical protein